MEYETVTAPAFGHSLSGLSINLLVRDVAREIDFLRGVLGIVVHRQSVDFAIVLYDGKPMQVHSDASFANHPLAALLPEAGPRGAGIELRLHETDPDRACALADRFGGVVLQPATDKFAHGLREAVILSPHGYAFIPSRRISAP